MSTAPLVYVQTHRRVEAYGKDPVQRLVKTKQVKGVTQCLHLLGDTRKRWWVREFVLTRSVLPERTSPGRPSPLKGGPTADSTPQVVEGNESEGDKRTLRFGTSRVVQTVGDHPTGVLLRTDGLQGRSRRTLVCGSRTRPHRCACVRVWVISPERR